MTNGTDTQKKAIINWGPLTIIKVHYHLHVRDLPPMRNTPALLISTCKGRPGRFHSWAKQRTEDRESRSRPITCMDSNVSPHARNVNTEACFKCARYLDEEFSAILRLLLPHARDLAGRLGVPAGHGDVGPSHGQLPDVRTFQKIAAINNKIGNRSAIF